MKVPKIIKIVGWYLMLIFLYHSARVITTGGKFGEGGVFTPDLIGVLVGITIARLCWAGRESGQNQVNDK